MGPTKQKHVRFRKRLLLVLVLVVVVVVVAAAVVVMMMIMVLLLLLLCDSFVELGSSIFRLSGGGEINGTELLHAV